MEIFYVNSPKGYTRKIINAQTALRRKKRQYTYQQKQRFKVVQKVQIVQ